MVYKVYKANAATNENSVVEIPEEEYLASIFVAPPPPPEVEPLLRGHELPPEATYIQRREVSYPSMVEQLDMQYWDAINGTTTWADAIAAVKAEYPKP